MSSTPNNQDNPPKEAPKPQPSTVKPNHTAASYEKTGTAKFDGSPENTVDFSRNQNSD
jgi:hypothetical protein